MTKNGCFSAVLRRLLCAGGLPTHPSSDTDNPKEQSTLPPSPTTTPAGVVARLMGLDSFPNSPIMRKSRSVGSLDYHNPSHRRLPTSVSFREVSTAFLHDFGKCEMGLTPIQEESKNLEEIRGGLDHLDQKKKKNEVEAKVCSVPFEIKSKRGVMNGAKKNLKKYKSRSKTYNHPSPEIGKHERKVKKKKKKRPMLKRREIEYSGEYCIEVLEEVCRLTMAEIEGCVWMGTKVVDDIEDLSYEFGQQILQYLVYEMVDELCSSLVRHDHLSASQWPDTRRPVTRKSTRRGDMRTEKSGQSKKGMKTCDRAFI